MWIVVSPVEVLDTIDIEVYYNLLYFARYSISYRFLKVLILILKRKLIDTRLPYTIILYTSNRKSRKKGTI
jgi:hypothetical protein